MVKSILLCVDESKYAVVAAQYAIAMAKIMESYVDVLYVSDVKKFSCAAISDFGGSLGVQPFSNAFAITKETEQTIANKLNSKCKKMFVDAGLKDKFKFNHKVGSFVYEIEQFKNDAIGLDLVVLGKNGEDQKFNETQVGESIESVIRTSQVPCLLANKTYRPTKRLLIGYNGSENCHKIIHFIERSDFFKDIQIDIIGVGLDEETKENASKVANIMRDAAHLDVTLEFLEGDLVDTICRYIKKHSIDMLAIGSYGSNIFSSFLFGDTTMELLESVSVPVLVAN